MGSMFVTSLVIAASLVTAQSDNTKLAAFKAGVTPSFEALVPAVLAQTRYGALNLDDPAQKAAIEERRSRAAADFEEAVAAHWPYDDKNLSGEQQKYRAAMREINSLLSRAKGGEQPKISRDDAIEQIMAISERYPDTEARDLAWLHIGHVYWSVKPRMQDESLQMHARLAKAKGSLSAYRIMGMVNAASVSADANQRLKDRHELLNTLARWRDPAVVKDRILEPYPMEGQPEYIRRITGTLINIEGFYANTSFNMMGDAQRSANPQEAINELLKNQGPNPYFQKAAERLRINKPAASQPVSN